MTPSSPGFHRRPRPSRPLRSCPHCKAGCRESSLLPQRGEASKKKSPAYKANVCKRITIPCWFLLALRAQFPGKTVVLAGAQGEQWGGGLRPEASRPSPGPAQNQKGEALRGGPSCLVGLRALLPSGRSCVCGLRCEACSDRPARRAQEQRRGNSMPRLREALRALQLRVFLRSWRPTE